MTSLLVLSVSAGAGHVRAADAIVKAAEAAHPPLAATHIDLLSLVPKDFRKLYGEQYIKLVEKLPQLWSFLYSKSDRPSRDSLVGKLKRAAEKLNTRKLNAEIERLAPDVILCTHFLPAELLSRQRASAEEQGQAPATVVGAGHGLRRARVVGAPARGPLLRGERGGRVPARRSRRAAREDFRHRDSRDAAVQRAARARRVRAELGLKPEKFTVLMMAGGAGVGSLDEMAQRVLRLPGELQLVALAGRNADLLKRLQALAKQHPGQAVSDRIHHHRRTRDDRRGPRRDQAGRPVGVRVPGKRAPDAAGVTDSRAGRAQRRLSTRMRRRHQSRGCRHARVQARAPARGSRPAGRHERGGEARCAAAGGGRRCCANIRSI